MAHASRLECEKCECDEYEGRAAAGHRCTCGHRYQHHTSVTLEDSGDDGDINPDGASPPASDDANHSDDSVGNILNRRGPIKLKPVKVDHELLLNAGKSETSKGLNGRKKTSGLDLIDQLDDAARETIKSKSKRRSTVVKELVLLVDGIQGVNDETRLALPDIHSQARMERCGLILDGSKAPFDSTWTTKQCIDWFKATFPRPAAYLEKRANQDKKHRPEDPLFRVAFAISGGKGPRMGVVYERDMTGELLKKHISNAKDREKRRLALVSKYDIPEDVWSAWDPKPSHANTSSSKGKSSKASSSEYIELSSDDDIVTSSTKASAKPAPKVKAKQSAVTTRSKTQASSAMKRARSPESSPAVSKRVKVSASPVAGPSSRPDNREVDAVPPPPPHFFRERTPPCPFTGIPPPPALKTYSSPS